MGLEELAIAGALGANSAFFVDFSRANAAGQWHVVRDFNASTSAASRMSFCLRFALGATVLAPPEFLHSAKLRCSRTHRLSSIVEDDEHLAFIVQLQDAAC